jgi:hypothetical protein
VELFQPWYAQAVARYVVRDHSRRRPQQPLSIIEIGGGHGTMALGVLVRTLPRTHACALQHSCAGDGGLPEGGNAAPFRSCRTTLAPQPPPPHPLLLFAPSYLIHRCLLKSAPPCHACRPAMHAALPCMPPCHAWRCRPAHVVLRVCTHGPSVEHSVALRHAL